MSAKQINTRKDGKQKDLVTKLVALAHRLGPGKKLPTVREMCGTYHVAIVTLSSVLDVLEARGVIERTHGHGIYVSDQINRKSIALVLGHDIFEAGLPPFYSLFIQACRRTLRRQGKHVFYFADLPETASAGSPFPVREDLQDAIRDNLLHGLILAPQTSASQGAWLRSTGLPVVGLSSSGEPGTISIDYHAMIERGVDALAAAGCRRLALVSPFDYQVETGVLNPRQHDRAVFRRALLRHGMIDHEGIFLSNTSTADGNGPFFRLGTSAADRLFGGVDPETRPEGVVILDESVAAGFLPTVQTMGLRLGRDVHVATHANLGVELLDPYVSAIHRILFDQNAVFNAAFKMLEATLGTPLKPPAAERIRPQPVEPPSATGQPPAGKKPNRRKNHEKEEYLVFTPCACV